MILLVTEAYSQTYTIPVVVHNMHDGNLGEMTNSEVIDMIDQVNDYYDDYTPTFQFKLATLSPNGSCGLAINDYQTSQPYGSVNNETYDLQFKNATRWPSNKYLNIWTVVDIDNGGAAGYAFTPTTITSDASGIYMTDLDPFQQNSPSARKDGVVFKYDDPVEYLIHEIAHYLNVLHVNGPDGAGSNSMWQSCHGNAENLTNGDFVADTPPVNYLTACNAPCSGGNSCTQDSPDNLDDKDNLMTICTPCISINSTLTGGQLNRMNDCMTNIRTNIASQTNLTATGVSPLAVVLDNPVIGSSTVWNTSNMSAVVDIMGDLTVEEDAVFRINAGVTVRFCKGAKLIVKKGGQLILTGALTSIGDNKWDGVEMWGDFSGVNPSKFSGRPNSSIKNASIGVTTYGPSMSQSGSFVGTSGMTFEDCDISIDAAPSDHWAYVFVRSTNFINNSNPDFRSFVRMNRWSGTAVFRNSTFSSTSSSQCIEQHGMGLEVENTHFFIDKCTFNDLGHAIKVNSGFAQQPFAVQESNFNSCYRGIASNSVGNFKIYNNTFSPGSLPVASVNTCTDVDDVPIVNQVSILLEGFMLGVDIQGNDFENSSNANSINIYADFIGPVNNKIRDNSFKSANGIVGVRSNSTVFPLSTPVNNDLAKRGLYFSCNDFFSAGTAAASIAVPNDPNDTRLGLRQIQFNVGANSTFLSAMNKWILTGEEINNVSDTDIKYFHNGGGFDPIDILGVEKFQGGSYNCVDETSSIFGSNGSGNGNPIDPLGPIDPIGPGPIPTPIPPTGVPSDLTTLISQQNGIEAQISNLGNASGNASASASSAADLLSTSLWETNDELLSEIIARYQFYPSVWNESTYISYLMKLDNIVGDYNAFKHYVGESQWANASSVLMAIPNKYYMNSYQTVDYNRILGVFGIINNTDLEQLAGTQVDDLVIVANDDRGTARTWARSILSSYGYNFTSTATLTFSKKRNEMQSNNGTGSVVKIYPNPSSDILSIEFSEDVGINAITIESIDGSVVYRQSSLLSTIDISNLKNGIYIIKFQNKSEVVSTKKFIKI